MKNLQKFVLYSTFIIYQCHHDIFKICSCSFYDKFLNSFFFQNFFHLKIADLIDINTEPGMEAEVRIFTLNCWGLGLGISKQRDERMQDIGNYIAENDFDIVFLQVRFYFLF